MVGTGYRPGVMSDDHHPTDDEPPSGFVWSVDDPPSAADRAVADADPGFEWLGDPGSRDGSAERVRRHRFRPKRNQAFAVGTVGVVVLLLLALSASPTAAHATFTAGDLALTGNAGHLTALTVAPSGDVHYRGLESPPTSVDVEVQVRLNRSSTWETVATTSVSASGRQGTANFSFAQINLLTTSSLQASDFRAADGSTSSTAVDIRVHATLVGAGPGGADVVATAADSFVVSVTNEPATAGAGGQANTAGQAA